MAVGDEQRLAGARASEFIVIHSVEQYIPWRAKSPSVADARAVQGGGELMCGK